MKMSKMSLASVVGDNAVQGQNKSAVAAMGFTTSTSRDENAKKEEEQGILRFESVYNDRSQQVAYCSSYSAGCVVTCSYENVQSMEWLVQLKNIFSKGLPRMPVDYITRMVMNKYAPALSFPSLPTAYPAVFRSHLALALLKLNKVIGGILYRPFLAQGFAEIVFLAIDSSQQIRVRLLN